MVKKEQNRKFYLAPLEGITGYIYRRAYRDFFPNMDKYFIPFVEPHRKRDFNAKEWKEICRENNEGVFAVPQILTNQAEDFIQTAAALAKLGYREINLNLGCPSGTVTARGKGSGFLEFPDKLDAFLDTVFTNLNQISADEPCRITVKTRIGRYEAQEFDRLLEIYNRYPLGELIVHPRTREDYYKNTPDWQTFEKAVKGSVNPLCYNGDIFTVEDYRRFQENFPQVEAIMLGRGIIRNPGLVDQILTGKETDRQKLRAFHDRIYHDYRESLSGERPVLFKMKELWSYQLSLFTEDEKVRKKLMKANSCGEYERITEQLFCRHI